MRDAKPWERQYGESHKAFEAFHEYCLLGNSRSIRKVAERLHKSLPLLGRWSTKWNWKDRVVEYDNELIRGEVEKAKTEISEMRKRQADIGQYFQSKGLEALKLKVANNDKLQYEELRDLMNLIAKGMQMENDARLSGLEMMTVGTKKAEANAEISAERRAEIERIFDD